MKIYSSFEESIKITFKRIELLYEEYNCNYFNF